MYRGKRLGRIIGREVSLIQWNVGMQIRTPRQLSIQQSTWPPCSKNAKFFRVEIEESKAEEFIDYGRR